MMGLRAILFPAVALIALAGAGCYDDCHCHSSAPYNVFIYVDPVFGDDTFGYGTPAFPLRSITRALQFTIAGDSIFCAPGTYSVASGELFPIRVKPGVIIQGDPTTRGNGVPSTLVSGSGLYTITGGTQGSATVMTAFVVGSSAGLTGLKITAAGVGGVGVVADNASPSITRCTVTGCGASGIRIYQSGAPTITDNVINANGGSGLDLFDTAAPALRQNTISANGADGVTANDTSLPNLGDASTAGANTLQANTGVGLNNATTASLIPAVGNTWILATQGADPSGQYASALTPGPVAPAPGNNFAIVNAAGSIQF